MRMEEAIKTYCQKVPGSVFLVPTDEYGHLPVNVSLLDNTGMDDETQFDILPAHFCHISGKCSVLVLLWKEFCKDNGFKQNAITQIEIVGGW